MIATPTPAPAGRSAAIEALRRGAVRGSAILAGRRAPWLVAFGLTALWFGYGVLRFTTLRTTAYDLAFFDQLVWNLARGAGFTSSFIPYSFLGQHFSPALVLFVPFYRLAPSPLWLLLGQALALGLAAVPLYGLACEWLDRSRAGAVLFAYALQIGIQRAIGYDFHTETLAVPFVFLALLAATRGRWRLFWVAAAVPILAKEDGTLVCFGIGLLVALTSNRRAGATLMGLSVAIAALLVMVVMPAFRGGQGGDLLPRYEYLLSGWVPAGTAALARLTDPESLWAVTALLAAVGFLPLLRPLAALAALPPLVLAMLSTQSYQHLLLLHYSLPATPLLVAAALLGWRRLEQAGAGPAAAGLAALVAGAAATEFVFSPLVGPLGINAQGFLDFPRAARAQAAVARIPAGAAVVGGPDVLPLLAERSTIAQLPRGRGLEWLLLDGNRKLAWDPARSGYTEIARDGEFSVWRLQPAS